jgi:glycosyltransferase involved in cell wall biosynthesis
MISIAMTTYNGAAFLAQQLDTIIRQTRPPDELIVCDDLSTDETQAILESYSRRVRFPMKVAINERRLGSTKNFEKAIRLCTGDLIALSDQDDVWRARKLEIIEEKFRKQPELGLVFTNGDLIDGSGAALPGDMWKAFHFTPTLQQRLAGPRAYDLLLSWPFITGATAVFRSEFRSLIVPIPSDAPTFVHDRWISVAIAAVADIGSVKDPLIAYRLHAQQQIGRGEPLLARLWMPYEAASDGRALAALRRRLSSNSSWRPRREFMTALERREKHVGIRTQFSNNATKRFREVAAELMSRRYNRYPMPIAQAVRDVLVGTV